MSVDYCIAMECKVKNTFGKGNFMEGTLEILDKLKAYDRAKALRKVAEREGRDPVSVKIIVSTIDENGNQVEKEVSIVEMEKEASVLSKARPFCKSCPVNVRRKICGCFGVINYPITEEAEAWLMSRLQPFDTFGASICLQYLTEFEVKGENIQEFRNKGLFEVKKPKKATLKKGLLGGKSVTSNQIIEPLFCCGGALSADHIFGFLVWFGAIRLDGNADEINDKKDIDYMLDIESVKERGERTSLYIGQKPKSDGTNAFYRFFEYLYQAWVNNVPLLISA